MQVFMELGPSVQNVGRLLEQLTPQGVLPSDPGERGQPLLLRRGDSAGEFQPRQNCLSKCNMG